MGGAIIYHKAKIFRQVIKVLWQLWKQLRYVGEDFYEEKTYGLYWNNKINICYNKGEFHITTKFVK